MARCTVERLMRTLGLRGVRRGGYKVRTTRPDPSQDRPEDLVNRDFAPDAPDRLQLVDFTFVATWAGTAYTALVIDAFSRLIAGWRTAVSHSTDLVLDALVMAVTYRARRRARRPPIALAITWIRARKPTNCGTRESQDYTMYCLRSTPSSRS